MLVDTYIFYFFWCGNRFFGRTSPKLPSKETPSQNYGYVPAPHTTPSNRATPSHHRHTLRDWELNPFSSGTTDHGHQRALFNLKSSPKVLASTFRFIWILMLWVYGRYIFFILSVCQNLTSVDVRPRISIMAVHPWHRYSNKAERAKEDTYDDFKLKNCKNPLVSMVHTNIFQRCKGYYSSWRGEQ